MAKLKIKKGDNVIVIAGRDRGKTGEVLRVMPEESRLLVQGVNMVKRHTAPRPGQPGGIVEKEASIHVSNLMVVCSNCDKPSRVGYRRLEDGRKIRICRKCNGDIDK